jgi:endonuclease G
MARKRARKGNHGAALLFALVLLAVGAYLAYVEMQRRRETPHSLEQSADLVTDERIIFGGAPRAKAGSGNEVEFQVLRNQGYIAGYSEARRNPLWVAYRVVKPETPYRLPRPSGFTTDLRTMARVKESDFSGSGYDRGHMAPNQAIMEEFGLEAQLETFLLSNICPQAPNLNRNVWERLEAQERRYAAGMEEVWVVDGPIFADLSGGKTERLASGIAVPAAFYKMVLDEEEHRGGKARMFAVVMPQNAKGSELPQEFLTTVSEIERQTHLDFFWKLEDGMERELEEKRWGMW